MHNTKRSSVIKGLLILIVAVFSACDEQSLDSSIADESEINALQSEMEVISSVEASVETNDRYIVLAQNSNQLQNVVNRLNAIDATVLYEMAEVGAVIVTSSDAAFKNNASGIRGVQSVIPDLVYNFNIPEPEESISIDALDDPPNSGSADFYFDLQWGHNAVRAHDAWAEDIRGEGVRVAVLDGGFDLTHPDLVPNINFGLSTNFVAGETLQYALPDAFSHGNHVAGTIAAAENDFGIIGVAPDAELVLVKVLGDAGSGSFGNIALGILHAAAVEADVINMSLGAAIPQSGIRDADGNVLLSSKDVAELRVLMNRVTNIANQSGAVVISSAGNSALDRDKTSDLITLPADMPNVISISATSPIGWATDPANIDLDNLASYSNYGRSAIDFAAPGGDSVYPGNELCSVAGILNPCWVFDLVFSTGNQGWYWSAGTSMASPHAAGIAALIISENGGSMKPAQVEAAMRQRAERLDGSGRSASFGMGRVSSGY